MVIDRGFFVENYVGEYKMKFDQELDTTFIVSKEFNHAEGEEIPLRKKRIFEFDRKDDEYIFLELANINISSDESILKYCNKYGLPCSSQICYDEEAGLDEDVDEGVARIISRRISDRYSRRDTMDRLEFCRLAVQIRSLMELKELLASPDMDQETCTKLIPLLTYLIFYSRAFIYDYDIGDPLPHTRIMSLQYSYHFFCKVRWNTVQFLSPADRVSTFLKTCKHLIADTNRVQDSMTLSDLESEKDLRVLRVFENIFLGNQCVEGYIELPNNTRHYEITIDRQTFNGVRVPIVIHTNNQFTVDEYMRVAFTREVKYDGDMKELKQLAFDVLHDAVNEGLTQITPRLTLDDGNFHGEWRLRHQIEGIFMEFFIELAKNSQYRLCANPTCGKYFSASRNRPGKMYCCHECGVLVAKRRQRARAKVKTRFDTGKDN